MIAKIAWRNIWRNKVRSFVVITAIALGLWAGVFASAFVTGMMEQKVDSVIELEVSHLQIHDPKFREDMLPALVIQNSYDLINEIENNKAVKGLSARVIAMPMINSANRSGAIKLTGIDPEAERSVTILSSYIEEGDYLESGKRNPILISKKTAEQYNVQLRSKVVLTLQDKNREITSAAFRVAGIYNTKNTMYDEMNAFVLKTDLQRLLDIDDGVHEVAVLLNQHELADTLTASLASNYPDLAVESWMDIMPAMRYMVELMDMYTYIIVGIILIALLFSIINTMLMAVLERVHEIGMLMAVGMSKGRVFKMILMESIFMTAIGGPLGLIISWISIQYFGRVGIDLGGAAYGDLGFSNIIYPYLDPMSYIPITIMVLTMAILAAVYPARKALSLKPVDAIQNQ